MCPIRYFVNIRNIHISIITAILVLHTISATAGELQSSSSNLATASDHKPFIGRQLFNDARYFLTEPDFYFTLGGVGLAPVLFSNGFDTETPKFTRQWGSSPFAHDFFVPGKVIGNVGVQVAVSVTTWGIGKLTESSKLQTFGNDLFRAQMANGVLTLGLKLTIDRPRPNGESYSYPSGHSSSSFTTAGVVYRHFGKRWGIPAYLVATYVGLSRLQAGKHYSSDVVAGAILGSYVSLKLTSQERRKRSFSVMPLNQNNSYGLLFSLKL